jgi:hypothetical protein
MTEKILNIIGYGLNRKRKRELPLTIVTNALHGEEPRHISDDAYTNKNLHIRYLYNASVTLLISWKIIYIIISAIKKKDFLFGGLVSFPVLIIIQYIYGIIYFNNDHIYKKIEDISIKTKFTIGINVALCISFALSISSVFLLVYGYDIYAYTELYNLTDTVVDKTFVGIFMFCDMIYSNSILAINFTSFAINLLVHKAEIQALIEKIEENITESISHEKKIGVVGQDYGRVRDKYGDTVNATSGIFSSLNILGFIHVCLLVIMFSHKKYNIFHIIYAIIFVIIDLIFIYVLQSVKTFIKKVNGIVSSTPFSVTYFSNKHIPLSQIDIESDTDNINKVIYTMHKNINIVAMNIRMLDQNTDWFGIQSITDKEWDKYVVCGVEFSDSKIIGNIIGLILAVIVGESTVSIINGAF